jgi:hypothetical protein
VDFGVFWWVLGFVGCVYVFGWFWLFCGACSLVCDLSSVMLGVILVGFLYIVMLPSGYGYVKGLVVSGIWVFPYIVLCVY